MLCSFNFQFIAQQKVICLLACPIARNWKQSRCPSVDEWMMKLCYIYTIFIVYWNIIPIGILFHWNIIQLLRKMKCKVNGWSETISS
ncbi:hypothetical protein I79_013120 [Cricetulus griseus]|uniref:Uncharacterized protein n=1 Tax=Cricetulus griseus TaxID=10029 RepID=G3HQL5_CRIGR|nr:hypothetical protein I79_013120 [Cricetulus griseus]